MIYMIKIFGKMFFYLIPLAIIADIVILSGASIFGAKISAYIKDNMNVGLRFGGAGIAKDIQNNSTSTSAEISANGSLVGTYDYYFHKSGSGSSFAPYIGAGVGLLFSC